MQAEDLLDIAYEVFLETAEENLSSAQIELFNQKFSDCGLIIQVETATDWEEEIGVLIDPKLYEEIWIGLAENGEQGEELTTIFAKCLINPQDPTQDLHLIWE